MTDKELRKIYAENYKQISLDASVTKNLENFSNNFVYKRGKQHGYIKGIKHGKLKRNKIVEAMTWQYSLIKNTGRAIVWRNDKFEIIENDSKKI